MLTAAVYINNADRALSMAYKPIRGNGQLGKARSGWFSSSSFDTNIIIVSSYKHVLCINKYANKITLKTGVYF